MTEEQKVQRWRAYKRDHERERYAKMSDAEKERKRKYGRERYANLSPEERSVHCHHSLARTVGEEFASHSVRGEYLA